MPHDLIRDYNTHTDIVPLEYAYLNMWFGGQLDSHHSNPSTNLLAYPNPSIRSNVYASDTNKNYNVSRLNPRFNSMSHSSHHYPNLGATTSKPCSHSSNTNVGTINEYTKND